MGEVRYWGGGDILGSIYTLRVYYTLEVYHYFNRGLMIKVNTPINDNILLLLKYVLENVPRNAICG